MELIDIGVNLAHRRFDADREQVMARARAAGVTRQVITGTSVAGSHAAAALARQKPGELWSTAGIHPHDAKHASPEALSELRDLTRAPEVKAIGECGLDFDRNFSPPAAQEAAFEAQLELAAETGLPVFLHQRSTYERFLSILLNARPRLRGGVAHCFTGSASELEAYLALDLPIGITGWINDERRGQGLREVVKGVPANRLMIETDAPFLTRTTRARGRRAGRRGDHCHSPRLLWSVMRATASPRRKLCALPAVDLHVTDLNPRITGQIHPFVHSSREDAVEGSGRVAKVEVDRP
jgi:TatD DNase family protein